MDKPKRSSKKLNYAALDCGDSEDGDEDFVNPSAPAKKKQKLKTNKENIEFSATSALQKIKSPSRKSPSKRIPLEEKKFQRELEKALQLSQCDKSKDLNLPQKKDKADVKGKNEFSGFDDISQDVISPFPDNSPECNPTVQKNLAKSENIKIEDNGSKVEPTPSTSTGFTGKRQRKKVDFKEEASEENTDGEYSNPSSESEWSDYSESPKKKTKNKQVSAKKSTSMNKETKTTKPVKIPKVIAKPKIDTKLDKCSTKSAISSSTLKHCIPYKTPSTSSQIGVGMVRKGFKSPLNSQNKVVSSPSRLSPGIGLRLGLSRRGNYRSLHPNASIK